MPARSPRNPPTRQVALSPATAQAQRVFTAPGLMTDDMLHAEIDALMKHEAKLARRWQCPRPDCDGLPHRGWIHRHARGKQHMPDGDWSLWLLLTGRGFGKTRTSAETVREWVKVPNTTVAVVARKITLVKTVCFEAPKAGLLAVLDPDDVAHYTKSLDNLRIVMKNGSVIRGFSAETPDNLNGNAFDKAWCDEYAVWGRTTAQDTWDTLQFCMREAPDPQIVVSTTPRGNKHMKKLLQRAQRAATNAAERAAAALAGEPEDDDTGAGSLPAGRRAVITSGSMHENRANLNDDALRDVEDAYGGTRLGAQEIEGQLLEDVEGALWTASTYDYQQDLDFRTRDDELPPMDRVVVAVDPATTSKETADRTAMAVVGRSYDRNFTWRDGLPHAFVLDVEQARRTPIQAMRRAVELYDLHRADAIVVEVNNGGDYLPALIHQVDPSVNVRVVNATRNKRARAAPIAGLYEREKVHHVGDIAKFKVLEEQQTTYVGADERGEAKSEDSPDLLDALVWGVTDLLVDRTAGTRRAVKDTRRERRF